jgi:hypothetical protein
MSARKNVNQSRPRALACGDALAVAGAVCFNVASDGRPTSARRSSRPPSNSSASVDSPLSPAPSGNYGVGFWPNAPRIRSPLSRSNTPHHALAGRSIGVCSQVLKYAKRGYFEKCCEFHKPRQRWNKVPKFRNRADGQTTAATLLRSFLSASDGHEAQRMCVEAEALGTRVRGLVG